MSDVEPAAERGCRWTPLWSDMSLRLPTGKFEGGFAQIPNQHGNQSACVSYRIWGRKEPINRWLQE